MKRILMVLVVVVTALDAMCNTETIGGITWTYTVKDKKATVGGGYYYNGAVPYSAAGAISIPSKLGGYTVTGIADYAFENRESITSITMPNTITTIGHDAFNYCTRLKSISLSDSLTDIGDSAFRSCSSLTSITIPGKVESIGDDAFNSCKALKSITILSNQSVDIGSCAFVSCDNLSTVELLSVSGIGTDAFSGCSSLKEIYIPNGLTQIPESAFEGCTQLTSVTIQGSVEYIDVWAFKDCTSLATVRIFGTSSTEINLSAFYNCRAIKSIIVPPGITSVKSAFPFSYTGIKDVGFSSGCTAIAESMFSGCQGLEHVDIPANVASIGNKAFEECSTITSISIPPCVTNIKSTFPSSYSSITNIVVVGNINDVPDSAFKGCTSLRNVVLPIGVKGIGDSAFSGCSGLSSVVIPSSVISIGKWAFNNCSGLTSIKIPECVTSIGVSAFSGCCRLTDVIIPSSVTSFGASAFSGCTGLTSATMSEGVTSIGNYAFFACSRLRSVIIPSSVTSIGEGAFNGCIELKSVSIPSNVTIIGGCAFYGCNGLQTVYISDLIKWLSISFADDYATPLRYAEKLFVNGAEVVDLVVPGSVKNICCGPFYGFRGLTSVTISEGVTSIGVNAFFGCSRMERVTIPSSVASIGYLAFYGTAVHEVWTDVGDANRVKGLLKSARMDVDSVSFVEPSNNIEYRETKGADNANPTSVWISTGITFEPLADVGGWRFAGWSPASVEPGHVGDVIAMANWEWITNCVTFSMGDHGQFVDASMSVQKVPYGSYVQLPQVRANAGWQFDGWRTASVGGEDVTDETIITEDVVFYAAWTKLDPIPEVQDDASPEQVADALAGSADAKLAACITNAANYNSYRAWANKIDPQAVKESPNAWVSFALGSDKLLENAPTDEDLTVEEFEPSGEAGKFDFTVSVEGVEVGSEAQKENLKQVFGLEGAATLDSDAFTTGNVDLAFGTPENGKVKFTAGPKDGDAKTFFMKVKVNP